MTKLQLNYTNLHTKNQNQSFEMRFLMFLGPAICINHIWPKLFVIYDHKLKQWLKCAYRKHWLISMCSSLMLKKNALTKKSKSNERRPANLGTALQQHWPLVRMKLMSFLSSSAVHGPFFNPTLSQQGCLPIILFSKHKCHKAKLWIERVKGVERLLRIYT